jgi:hypothetical protein
LCDIHRGLAFQVVARLQALDRARHVLAILPGIVQRQIIFRIEPDLRRIERTVRYVAADPAVTKIDMPFCEKKRWAPDAVQTGQASAF